MSRRDRKRAGEDPCSDGPRVNLQRGGSREGFKAEKPPVPHAVFPPMSPKALGHFPHSPDTEVGCGCTGGLSSATLHQHTIAHEGCANFPNSVACVQSKRPNNSQARMAVLWQGDFGVRFRSTAMPRLMQALCTPWMRSCLRSQSVQKPAESGNCSSFPTAQRCRM